MERRTSQDDMGPMMRNLTALVGVCSLVLAMLADASSAMADDAKTWSVSVAADGFSNAEVSQVRAAFAPMKLASGGNQALYTYLNMAEFFPHQLIARGGLVKHLPFKPRAELAELRVETELGNLSLGQLMDDPRTRLQGMVVLHRGNIVLEKYTGMRAEDSHLWWSLAKLLAGVVVEQLIDEGQVDADAKIVSYLSEFADTAWSKATVGNILDMASGIDALDTPEGYADPQSGIGRLIYAEGVLVKAGYSSLGHDKALKSMASLRKPGTRYQYSSANTNMLALLIERVTGMRYGEALQERIWSKIGAEGDGLLGLTPNGRAIAHGMYSSRLRDLARFGQLFTPAGHNAEIIPAAILKKIADNNGRDAYLSSPTAARQTETLLGQAPVGAASQWDALFADGDLFKSGYDGQALYVSPGRDVVIAMYSTSKDKSVYRYLRPIAMEFESIISSSGLSPIR